MCEILRYGYIVGRNGDGLRLLGLDLEQVHAVGEDLAVLLGLLAPQARDEEPDDGG